MAKRGEDKRAQKKEDDDKRKSAIAKLQAQRGKVTHEYQPPEEPEGPETSGEATSDQAPAEQESAAANPPEEAQPQAPKKPRASKAASSSASSRAAVEPEPELVAGRWPAWMLELPGAELHGTELFMRRGNQLHPFSGPAKMTFGVTLEEQLRFQRYAKVRGRDYVDVFREFVGHILSGEAE